MDLEYKALLHRVMTNGKLRTDRTGVGTRSTFGETLDLDVSNNCFPLLALKRVPMRWCFEETRWFLSGASDERILRAKGVDIWKEWATKEQCAKFGREEGDLGPIYGPLWRNFSGQYFHGDDQIKCLIQDCLATPDSRRLIVTGWNPTTCRTVALPPCHTLWQLYIDEDKVSLQLYARSIDIVLGLPFDVAMYGLLLYMIAAAIDKKPSMLHIRFGDLHLYNNHQEAAELMMNRVSRTPPKLTIAHEPWARQGEACSLDVAHARMLQLINTNWEQVSLQYYDPHPAIKCDVAV